MSSLSKAQQAFLGGIVADAACMPLHWIYEKAKALEALGDTKEPEFFGTPSCPYYGAKDYPGHYATGDNSMYGEQMEAVLGIVAELPAGDIEPAQFVSAFSKWAEGFTGYKGHALKNFLENVQAGKAYPDSGADDKQAQCFGKVPVAVLRYKADGVDVVLKNLEVLVRTHQNTDLAVDSATVLARLLLNVIDGQSIADAWSSAKEHLPDSLKDAVSLVEKSLDKSAYDMLMAYGATQYPDKPMMSLSCLNPQAFMGALHSILTAKSYEEGVKANLTAWGDNCSRGTAVGAILGAAYGVPESYSAKFNGKDRVVALLSKY